MMLRAILAFILLVPTVGHAATLRSVTVDRVDGVYVMRSEVWFDVGIDKIFGVLLDWDQSTKFSSVIVESRNLAPAADGRGRFYASGYGFQRVVCVPSSDTVIVRLGQTAEDDYATPRAWIEDMVALFDE